MSADLDKEAMRQQRDELRRTVPVKHCAFCGKRMTQLSGEYVWRNGHSTLIGYRPARNSYAPFCTLACAWAFGDAAFKAGYRMKGR